MTVTKTEQSIEEILLYWQERLGNLRRSEPLHEKRTVWRVKDSGGRNFVLKRVEHPDRLGGIEAQARILQYLERHSVPVAPPIPTDAGQSAAQHAEAVYTLSPYLPGGTYVAKADLERAHRNMGRAIAQLHKTLALYPEPIRSWEMDLTSRIFDRSVLIIRERVVPVERTHFESVLAGVESEMRHAFAGLPSQYIHGDCHASNILLHVGEVAGFIDLDHLPRGPVVYDPGYLLADMIKRKIGSEEGERRWVLLSREIMTGYGEITRLSSKERDGMWAIMLAVQMLFTEFFLQVGNQEEAEINLNAFFWLASHRKRITERVMAVDQL